MAYLTLKTWAHQRRRAARVRGTLDARRVVGLGNIRMPFGVSLRSPTGASVCSRVVSRKRGSASFAPWAISGESSAAV